MQLSAGSLTGQQISASLGENRQQILQPNEQITLPVLVDMTSADTVDLASLQLRVTWDPEVLGYTSWSAGAFGTIEANEDAVAGGTFQANLISTTGTASSFTAMNLTFDAGTAGSTVAVLGMLAAGSESGGDLLSRIVAKSVSICINAGGILGDVTSGDLVDVIDAQQIARWVIGLAVTTSNRMRSHGDVNNDGKTNIVDAQQVARSAVQLPVEYPIGVVISLSCSDALTVSTTSLPSATVGNTYGQALSAAGADGTYSWSISSGTFPAGLTLVGSTISGTPTANGTSEFTAKVTSGDGQTATRPLSITVFPALSMTLDSLPSSIVDSTYSTTLTATGGDGTYSWSIASGTLPAGLTLSADTISGTPTTTETSTFTVQVTSGDGQTATKELSISVVGIAATLELSSSALSFASIGDTATLVATVRNAEGTLIASPTVTWATSDTTIATVSAAGVVTAKANGTATITATSGSATATATVAVAQASASVTLSQTSVSFASFADTTTLTATVRDTDGTIVAGATVTWASSDTTIATVSSAGLVTAASNGTVTITATSGAASATASATINQVPNSVTLAPTTLILVSLGDTATLTALVKDANDSTIASPTVTWASSDTTVATVSAAGLVTAIGNDTATITAASGSVSATATTTVSQVASSVTLSPDSLSFTSLADTATLTATVKDTGGSAISGATVTWATSAASVATVSSAGLVTAVATGSATITATSVSASATAAVTVSDFLLAANGVTIICSSADIGDTGEVGGVTYTKRSKAQID
ncbi:uncharacterized protein METZ01_LOCUS144489, partial [marine metagenome]